MHASGADRQYRRKTNLNGFHVADPELIPAAVQDNTLPDWLCRTLREFVTLCCIMVVKALYKCIRFSRLNNSN